MPTMTPVPSPTWTATPVPIVQAQTSPAPVSTATATAISAQARIAIRQINVRSGPGLVFPAIGTAREGETYQITGHDEANVWWRICCLTGDKSGWVRGDLVTVEGDTTEISLVQVPMPTPRPTSTATPIPPTPPPAQLFYRGAGPIFMPTNNAWLTLWIKVYGGTGEGYAIPGWRLQVQRNGQTLLTSEPSQAVFMWSAPPGSNYGNRVPYNIKVEIPQPGEATWDVYLVDDNNAPRSPVVQFTTSPTNPNREIFIGFLSAQ